MGPVNEIPYLIKAKNGEHWFLMNQLFGVLSAEVAASLGISTKVEAARKLFERETAVYKPLKAYQDTEDVDASDARRDKSYRRFDLGVQSAELSDDTSVADAAKRVRFVLNQMSKKLTVKAYAEETAEIFDLIDKLEKDHSEDVETIGQTANLAALKEANEAFNEIYKRRTEEMQAREEAGTVEQIRPQVDEAVRYVVCLLNALYFYYLDIAPDAEKLAEVKGVISQFNGCVLQFRKTLARRGIGSASDKEEVNPEEDTTPDGTETPDTETPGGEDTETPDGEGGEQTTPTDPGTGEVESPEVI